MITVTITPTHLGKARKRIDQLIKKYGSLQTVPDCGVGGYFANCVLAVAAGEKMKKGVDRCNALGVTFRDGRRYKTVLNNGHVDRNFADLIRLFDRRDDADALDLLPLTATFVRDSANDGCWFV